VRVRHGVRAYGRGSSRGGPWSALSLTAHDG
jgi:hypothetical protein